jgi:hypothetical protein
MMEAILIIGIFVLIFLIVRPAPRPPVVYVPEDLDATYGGFGCLPVLLIGILALVLLGAQPTERRSLRTFIVVLLAYEGHPMVS